VDVCEAVDALPRVRVALPADAILADDTVDATGFFGETFLTGAMAVIVTVDALGVVRPADEPGHAPAVLAVHAALTDPVIAIAIVRGVLIR